MQSRHFKFWPKGKPYTLPSLDCSVLENLLRSAERYTDHAAIIYYDSPISYRDLRDQSLSLGFFLKSQFNVETGDRVLLYMQNSPQFVIGYYGILAAGAVVVPVNPMNKSAELEYMISDTHAEVMLAGQEVVNFALPLLKTTSLKKIIYTNYADYLLHDTDLELPSEVTQTRKSFALSELIDWQNTVHGNAQPPTQFSKLDDWCVIPYSSGSTGQPRGCIHSNRTVNANISAYANWRSLAKNAPILASLPLFHVTGMQNSMNVTIYSGGTIVLMTRWNSAVAAKLIQRYKIVQWRAISTMIIDFVSSIKISNYDLSSLEFIGGGGAQLPSTVAEKLKRLTALEAIDGYGLTESMAALHINPPHAPKTQCLGIPLFGVDTKIINPQTHLELGVGEIGEIISRGPQIFLGYLGDNEATKNAFINIDRKRYFRTGDLGYYDEDGYYFYVDRLKRMINVSGFKVWPTEIESILHKHPDIREVCVIAKTDSRQGETVKALIVLEDNVQLCAETIKEWCHTKMASYKVPRAYKFVESLPRSGSGKLEWRKIQEKENCSDLVENLLDAIY
jgi:fatty-acyl-CoA synthase